MSLTPKQLLEIEAIRRDPDAPVTQAAYARYAGLDRSTVSKLVTAGTIATTSDKKIIPAQADLARGVNHDADENETLAQYKIEKAKHDARLAKQKADEAEGKIVSREHVIDYYYRTCRVVTERLEAMPKNLAHPLSLTHDQQQILKTEIQSVLDYLTETLIHKD